jgi:hypothetical protein
MMSFVQPKTEQVEHPDDKVKLPEIRKYNKYVEHVLHQVSDSKHFRRSER